ncbi:hypothetical protein BKG67_23030 [Mycobacteroides chelonae]|nr:hypothetical protein BKG66_24495 [Mycobacteroides chelonae]OHT69431.1 hypothetical protein BKG67_23030 [Mycobacteroides chelonae]
MTVAEEKKRYRSVSQVQQYEKCPQAYYLARIKKVWKRPAAWLYQGSAVHEAIEAWEQSRGLMTLEEAQEVFRESYAKHVNEACQITPNFEFWSRSGRYGGQADVERRFGIGLEQVEKYLNWRRAHPEEKVWITPDGVLAVELKFDFELDGIPITGFIDQVMTYQNDEGEWVILVRDAKTGNRVPEDDFQLGVYALALAEVFGVPRPTKGDYWMGKTGKPVAPYDLSEWTREAISAKFQALEQGIQAERFDALPESDKCMFCDVSASCSFAFV